MPKNTTCRIVLAVFAAAVGLAVAGCESSTCGCTEEDAGRGDISGAPETSDSACVGLLIDNDGVPEGYPFHFTADDEDRQDAEEAVRALFAAHGLGLPASLRLDQDTLAPSWEDALDLTPDTAESTPAELEAAADTFVAANAVLLRVEGAVRTTEALDDDPVVRLVYAPLDYCGLPLAGDAPAIAIEPVADGVKGEAAGWLSVYVRTDGWVDELRNEGFPRGVKVPKNPVLTPEQAAAVLVGREVRFQCEGEVVETVAADDAMETGGPGIHVVRTTSGLEYRLAYAITVEVGDGGYPFTFIVDAVTGEVLLRTQSFVC